MRFLTWIMVFAVLAGQPAQLLRNRAQLRTVRSLTELEEGRLFRLDYKADYRRQDFVDADLDSKEAVQGGVAQMLLDFSSLPAGSLSAHGPSVVLGAGKMSFRPACSAFQAVTPDGEVIYGRNFDYDFDVHRIIREIEMMEQCRIEAGIYQKGHPCLYGKHRIRT